VVLEQEEEEEKKVAIVTGCNTGIGYETAKTLATLYGYTVIMACRDEAKARIAAAQIGSKNAIFVAPLDLSSFQSVLDFCRAIQAQGYGNTQNKKIHLLVNNAGRNTSGQSIDGLDLQFQTNFLGHFFLTKLLVEQNMMADQGARIVNLASVMHHFCNHINNIETVEFWKNTAAVRPLLPTVFGVPVDPLGSFSSLSLTGNTNTYPLSKLAAILFTNELNRRYPSPLVTSIAVNPGAV
jgi:NAD(P)-dependent dehydrogenase (short-subunit alcohol dehydrogenase family)